MKNIIVRYGLYSAVFLVAVGIISFYLLGGAEAGPDTYGYGEVIGYSSIVISMLFVYLGIKKYRDEEKMGYISFGQALKMGSLIVLFPAIAFTIYNVFYAEVMDPEFADKYYEFQLEKMKSEADPSEYASIESTMASQKEMFANVPFQSFVMFLTVYVIGFIMSVLSSIILSRKNTSP